ncbi:MAG: GTPase HflX [Bacteroidales bacterium]|jgi:GTP-binding protein HflX|nr:GTPase HflX [Bacteroidales bacterium]
MKEFILSQSKSENAVLVGLITKSQNEQKTKEYLDELAFLADTAGAVPVKRFVQRLETPNNATYVGPGKLEEIKQFCKQREDEYEEYLADYKAELANARNKKEAQDIPLPPDPRIGMVIFDDDLGPKQLQILEKELGCKILDRTSLILDIFASRAQTDTAKTQVELAQYQYLLPRLTGLWTHLERQKGGIGMRGPGETQIETDRRIVLDRISLCKKWLEQIDRQKATQRKNRGKLVRVALVGYTNVGKSTLLNLLAKSDVFAENKLFATLDTTVRKVIIDNLPFLMSDTVGFIRKLPTHLVESFKSTLDEVREADLLVHVVDISHPTFEDQIRVVEETLNDICRDKDARDEHLDDRNGYNRKDKRQFERNLKDQGHSKPTLLVFNKIDNYSFTPKDEDDLTPATRENISLDEMKQTWMARMSNNCIFISAKSGQGIDELKSRLYEMVKEIHTQRFPYNDFLFQKYDEEMTEEL